MVREMAEACKEYGLKLGIYVSPWDRNHPDYGKPEYITYFRNQIKELVTEYGPIFEIWFDGANGGTGYYGGANENRKIDRTIYYDWKNTYKMIRELQPDSDIGIYNAPVFLNAPTIMRNQSGEITITTNDIGPYFYYTLDGSNPTQQSKKYTGPVPTSGKVEVKAIAYDPSTDKSSPVALEKFDVSRKDWKIVAAEDEKVYAVLDGNISTTWHQRNEKMPVDLVIDFGNEQNLSGLKYHPDQRIWEPGIITHYEFYVSADGKKWKLLDQGEFSNIKNNPVWQIKKFAPIKARLIKLRALKNTEGSDNMGYAEIDVITE